MDFVTAPFALRSAVEGRPCVLAGPASVESAQQVSDAARRLRGAQVDLLTSEAWSGSGPEPGIEADDRALAWLLAAARQHELRAATTVASPRQAETALAAGVDLLILAGESVAEPAAIKALAHVLRGARVPVLVANPPHPELEPWLEALARLAAAGVGGLGAMHCGFAAAGAPGSREALGWELVIELRRRLPTLPVVAAVSRLAGERGGLAEIAQSALDLGLQGLHFETHPDPDHAWHAAERQVTPERAVAILAGLAVRRPDSDEAGFHRDLDGLRDEIDRLDRALLELLARRMRVVDRIGGAKRERNVAALQVERWRAMVEARREWATALGLDAELARQLFAAVHAEAVRRQSTRRPHEDDAVPPGERA